MPEFDAEAFITQLEHMGMMLTALPMADGKLRGYRWRLMAAFEHAQQIEALWKSQIGDDQARIDVLASRLSSDPGTTAGQHAPMSHVQRLTSSGH
jgi:hypothetical protein